MTIVPNLTVVIQIAIILVLMFLLNTLLFKPMMSVLNERRARTQGRRERAAEAEAQAEKIWKDYQTSLSEARHVADKARLEIVRQGELERSRITDTASASAEKTVAEVKARVAVEASKAAAELKAQVDTIGRAMAEKIAGRAI